MHLTYWNLQLAVTRNRIDRWARTGSSMQDTNLYSSFIVDRIQNIAAKPKHIREGGPAVLNDKFIEVEKIIVHGQWDQ